MANERKLSGPPLGLSEPNPAQFYANRILSPKDWNYGHHQYKVSLCLEGLKYDYIIKILPIHYYNLYLIGN